ncbi:thiamine phosphate synthase [Fluviispira multicolorata]|uniref:Thiamine phosphate synthase n=1 Tax=Fluviispira multicolorata TaxID=2654512 RepID=A0A833N3X3_9BACT|nr:thiamine phosphate synthase [Fluviispira multicolorata]KAB8029686.1 thiamine phosphate synthase [Fluviispira multicolorata]
MLESEKNKMRFYPIVDNFYWVKKLVHWGVKSIQLRIKDNNNFKNNSVEKFDLETEIKLSIDYCKRHQCQLFINDYWEIALRHQAYGVHLGYEDSQSVDIKAIHNAKIKLGLSTHDYNELDFALKQSPSYVALGPIFPTQTKIMRFAPQGILRINEWRELIPRDILLVAIGGISLEHGLSIYSKGANSISVINDFKSAQDPEKQIKNWIKLGKIYEF